MAKTPGFLSKTIPSCFHLEQFSNSDMSSQYVSLTLNKIFQSWLSVLA